jgi:DNA adenine methylase
MNALAQITRPVLRWHGGKWRLAPWVISHFPPHRIYVEAFAGAASVLLRKERAYAEVYNDLDSLAFNLFCILRDRDQAARLIELLRLTPFAREEFEQSIEPGVDPLERARRLIVRSFMGFGSNAHSQSPHLQSGFRPAPRFQAGTRAKPRAGPGNYRSTGFRSNSDRSGTTPAHDWRNYPDALVAIVERFQGVVIENRDAVEIMRQHDSTKTLHYVDPPYLPETRSPANKYDLKHRAYRHELTRDDHVVLLAELKTLAGMVVLSGYPSGLYDSALGGGLAAHRDRRSRRRRASSHGSPVAQPRVRRRARPSRRWRPRSAVRRGF